MKNRCSVLFALGLGMALIPAQAIAQSKITLSGTVREAKTGEGLIGAAVSCEELKVAATTNAYGFYSLSLPPGTWTIRVQFIGFQEQKSSINLGKSATRDFDLAEETVLINEIVVTDNTGDDPVRNTEMSVARLNIKEVKKIPQLLGEVDIIRTLTLLPGVSTVGEGASGFNVRGGNVDQNLILLDEAPVFNSSHLLGFFSVFNPDAVKDLKLFKGGTPAEYGGRLSSVLDVRQKEGNNKSFSGRGGLGLLSSRLLLEGPILKDKLSYMVAGRRSYADIFLALSNDPMINRNVLYFYDFNAKMNWKIDDKNSLFASGYYGKDVFGIDNLFSIDWGNSTTTLRWNSILSDKLFFHLTGIYSDYQYSLGTPPDDDFVFRWNSRIQNTIGNASLRWYSSPQFEAEFGVQNTYYVFDPAEITGDITTELERQIALEPALYVSFQQKVGVRWNFEYGLRSSAFYRLGPGTEELYNPGEAREDTSIVGSVTYESGELIKGFNFLEGLEPRFTATYLLDENQSLKLSYQRMRQYIHLISNTTSPTPVDIWRPAGMHIDPATSDQIAAGWFRNFQWKKAAMEFSLEAFYKDSRNVLDYKYGAELLFKENIETELLPGHARSYGLEVLLRKNSGKLTGWVAYTLSRSEIRVSGPYEGETINEGDYYATNYDKTHDITIVATYTFSPKWDVGAIFSFQTGRPATYPSARAEFETGITYPVYNNRNQDRIPNYHRLDLSANWTPNPKPDGRWESSWSFGVYNAYGRRNAFSVYPRQNEDNPQITELVRLSVFGSIIPSVTYNFKF